MRVSPVGLRPRGFTLIELLVSVAIFTVVMVVALGALLSMVESDRKAQTLKTITNNLSFAIDSMSRSIRTGTNYNCGSPSGGDCSTGNSILYFRAIDGNTWAYRWNSSGCSNTLGCIERSQDGGSSWAVITAPEVVITTLTFYVVGSASGNTLQPKVTILLRGFIPLAGGATSLNQCGTTGFTCSKFDLQTTVTQRIYDQ